MPWRCVIFFEKVEGMNDATFSGHRLITWREKFPLKSKVTLHLKIDNR
jgi:hypothetical protein